ncbi:MAG: hypothetical protein OXC69_05050, partial [Candidatus Tectomicrobia bacterium]|nr:hypothetical protein [Candidatus Tectomicrobia bacterium]
ALFCLLCEIFVLKVLRIVVSIAFKSGKTKEFVKRWFKRRRTDRKGTAGIIGGLLVAAFTLASLLWMHHRLGVIEERLMTIEENHKGNVTVKDKSGNQ